MRWEEPTGLPFVGLASGGFLAIGMIMIMVVTSMLPSDIWVAFCWVTIGYYVAWCVTVILACTLDPPIARQWIDPALIAGTRALKRARRRR